MNVKNKKHKADLILVVNAGSTSYKCRLFDMETEKELASGGVERIGSEESAVSYRRESSVHIDKKAIAGLTHVGAVKLINEYLCSPALGAIENLREIGAVGFKTVQAGQHNGSVVLSKAVTDSMKRYSSLAPAHNPPYLACIHYFEKTAPSVPRIGVFEPGFHVDIPQHSRIFGTPFEWYERFQVKKYGYHGATFRYVTDFVADTLKRPKKALKIIACHLGGSSSVCAIDKGSSIDVSMSFTPQSGIIQSSRVGDIDPFVLPYIMKQKKISLQEALDELCSNGGLKGISGVSSDMRDILLAAKKGNPRATLSVDKFVYDVVRYIGSFYAVMGGVDVIAFSGGIGFNNPQLRSRIIGAVSFLGIDIDKNVNDKIVEGIKTIPSSKIQVVTVNTNEEIVVARETQRVLHGIGRKRLSRN